MKTPHTTGEEGSAKTEKGADKKIDLDAIRPELEEVRKRHAFGLDENRPDAVAKRHQKNQRTVRANVEDLCDPGRFIEYGALTMAAQRGRRSEDDLIRRTPGDGLIAGIGAVNSALVGDERARCSVLAYDYTVWLERRDFSTTRRWTAC
jgi:acetyl-CoA carboxylase carboxyltransferase component